MLTFPILIVINAYFAAENIRSSPFLVISVYKHEHYASA